MVKSLTRTLGVCYYPEHWPREIWPEDAARMADIGLTRVRIGEFAWSRLEPKPGALDFDWLDEAIEVLGSAGLKLVLGTPTATPPRWMIDKHPDMLAVDVNGNLRKFGSRRHYCMSHEGYREECQRIVQLLAERYGNNPHIAAWQTDNEYGCHDTTLSYSNAARLAFRQWLREAYQNVGSASGQSGIEALNSAWGNVFWSMEYSDFDEIDLPNLTVTEPNPAHVLAFRRFSSDQVASFNRLQTEIIRQHSDKPLTHNYMGRITDFDHFKVGDDLDFASWDSYPLGFLEDRIKADRGHKVRFARQGDPDFQAFHHDLYRAVGKGRWWVMEQQPGPVNWAPRNPAPLPGMVRLWTWEAFAHGAEAVCYFRWRQLAYGQEQMHTGLLQPDSEEAPAMAEAWQVAAEVASAPQVKPPKADVAILFDYDADAAWATQPQGKGLNYFQLVFDQYRALRSLGMTIDILPVSACNFDRYALVLAPGLMHMSDGLKQALMSSKATVIFGPRSGVRTREFQIPDPLPPALPGLEISITGAETFRADMPQLVEGGFGVREYREFLAGREAVALRLTTGEAIMMGNDNKLYLGGWLDQDGFRSVFSAQLISRGITPLELPEGVRVISTGDEEYWFNFDTRQHEINGMSLSPISVEIRRVNTRL